MGWLFSVALGLQATLKERCLCSALADRPWPRPRHWPDCPARLHRRRRDSVQMAPDRRCSNAIHCCGLETSARATAASPVSFLSVGQHGFFLRRLHGDPLGHIQRNLASPLTVLNRSQISELTGTCLRVLSHQTPRQTTAFLVRCAVHMCTLSAPERYRPAPIRFHFSSVHAPRRDTDH